MPTRDYRDVDMEKSTPRNKTIATKTPKRQDRAAVDPAFEHVAAAFAGDPRVRMKRMFSSENVLTIRGKIFAMLVRGALVVKLPRQRVDELVGGGRGERFDPGHGRLMKEWVAVKGEGESWVGLAREALRFVNAAKA